MGGSTADTPTTPEFFRASDADREHAVDELRDEFVEGRLSHETFVYRMQTALDARNHGQLARLFTDLPPRRTRLLARIRTALRGRSGGTAGPGAGPGQQAGPWPQATTTPRPLRGHEFARADEPSADGGQAAGYRDRRGSPAPLSFPPGRGDRFTIGRTRDCDLCLTDLSVSRLHAELVRSDGGWLLNDLGSHNGTRLNGWLVRETVPVREGDRLEFGSMAFVVSARPPGPPVPG